LRMKIRVLGAHNCERKNFKMLSLLVDGVLAIDAGALTSSLSLEEQKKIRALLLTHQHYDHVRDVPALAMNLFLSGAATRIYSIPAALDVLAGNLLNDQIYPDFRHKPEEKPTVSFTVIEPNKVELIEGYTVLAVPVSHSVPTVGYQVTDAKSRSFFYAGDAGPGLAECWRQVSPRLLIIEVTASDRYTEWAAGARHLTPSLLREELESFQKVNGYLPKVVAIHMNPDLEGEIAAEVAAVAKALNCPLTLAYEGMEISI
jgi:ribonuclease BN (tRNA processing enzyme)